MTVSLRALSFDVSQFLLIPMGMALLSLPVCILAQEWFAIAPMLLTALCALTLSGLLRFLGKKSEDTSLYQAFISVALGWALISAMGALPLWLTALSLGTDTLPTVEYFRNGLNALFEGVSGFTSAGLTMAIHPSELPASLQWWRSLMQWVGGVGVVVLGLALMEPTQNQYVLYQAEGRQTQLRLTITGTVRRIWKLYIGYTLASIVLFRICRMTWWEALNHGMTAISTGGFSVTDGSMSGYSAFAKLAIILVMVVGAISFSLHDQILKSRRLSVVLRDRQHLLLVVVLIGGTLILAVDYFTFTQQFAWIDSAFHWASALTTCGFSTQSLFFWSSSNKILLSIAMILGGAAGSTAGGIKLERALALLEAIAWRLRRPSLSAHQFALRWINGKPLKPIQASRQIEDATALVLMWVTVIVIGVFILMRLVPAEYSLIDVIFEVSSALGAAGISVGISSPSLHWLGKIVIIVLMWMGRLEIFPVLLLLSLPFNALIRLRE